MNVHRRIELKGFALPVSIGIHAFEKRGPQRVIVDLDLLVADPSPLKADRIAEAVDYDGLRDGIRALVKGRHFNLQETLCQAIVDLCLADSRIAVARVRTRKPDVYPDCEWVGCEIEARR